MSQESIDKFLILASLWNWVMAIFFLVFSMFIIWLGFHALKNKHVLDIPEPDVDPFHVKYMESILDSPWATNREFVLPEPTACVYMVPPGLKYINPLYLESDSRVWLTLGQSGRYDFFAKRLGKDNWNIGMRWSNAEWDYALVDYATFIRGGINRDKNPVFFIGYDLLMEYIDKQQAQPLS